jgi:hypothetical protein
MAWFMPQDGNAGIKTAMCKMMYTLLLQVNAANTVRTIENVILMVYSTEQSISY